MGKEGKHQDDVAAADECSATNAHRAARRSRAGTAPRERREARSMTMRPAPGWQQAGSSDDARGARGGAKDAARFAE